MGACQTVQIADKNTTEDGVSSKCDIAASNFFIKTPPPPHKAISLKIYNHRTCFLNGQCYARTLSACFAERILITFFIIFKNISNIREFKYLLRLTAGPALYLLGVKTKMGKTRGLYNPEYPIGTIVRVIGQADLDLFRRDWRYHHPLEDEQMGFAGVVAAVIEVGFYHGGDELYKLEGVPGIWHEGCIERA